MAVPTALFHCCRANSISRGLSFLEVYAEVLLQDEHQAKRQSRAKVVMALYYTFMILVCITVALDLLLLVLGYFAFRQPREWKKRRFGTVNSFGGWLPMVHAYGGWDACCPVAWCEQQRCCWCSIPIACSRTIAGCYHFVCCCSFVRNLVPLPAPFPFHICCVRVCSSTIPVLLLYYCCSCSCAGFACRTYCILHTAAPHLTAFIVPWLG